MGLMNFLPWQKPKVTGPLQEFYSKPLAPTNPTPTSDGKYDAKPKNKPPKPLPRPKSQQVVDMKGKSIHQNEKIINQNKKPKGTRQKNKTSAASAASQKTEQAKKASQNAGEGKTKSSLATSKAAKHKKTTATAT